MDVEGRGDLVALAGAQGALHAVDAERANRLRGIVEADDVGRASCEKIP